MDYMETALEFARARIRELEAERDRVREELRDSEAERLRLVDENKLIADQLARLIISRQARLG